MREKEKIQDKVATRQGDKQHVQTIDKTLSWRDNHAITAVANANLMGFQAPPDDDDFESRRGGRGDRRGGRDQGPREDRRGGRKGRGGKLVIDDDAFPAL